MPPSHFHCHLVSAQGLGRVGPDTHRILREPPNGHLSSGATHVSALCAAWQRTEKMGSILPYNYFPIPLAHGFVLNRGAQKDTRIRE